MISLDRNVVEAIIFSEETGWKILTKAYRLFDSLTGNLLKGLNLPTDTQNIEFSGGYLFYFAETRQQRVSLPFRESDTNSICTVNVALWPLH